MKSFDAIIVGGGLIGSAIALELAGEKLRVIVIDRQQPGREASWAAAGMLSPGPDSPEAAPLVPLGKESLRLYPEFIAAVEEASGMAVNFVRAGTFEVFTGPQSESARDATVKEYRRLELAIETISPEAARAVEPSLGRAAAVAWLPEEATVDPRLLTGAVLAGAERHGAEIQAGCAVDSLLCRRGTCAGVVADGEKIEAANVIIAAGSFCGTIRDCGSEIEGNLARHAPVRPVRGQMIALRSESVKLQRVLRSQRGYLVPRPDGRIVAGSTLEDAGFVKQVTPEGIQQILDGAMELAPALVDAEIVEQWAGLRPDTPDHLPIIGPTEMSGLVIATGHYRNGILLAPVTAKIVRDWIVSGKASFSAENFSPLRFAAARSHARTSS